MQHGITLAQRRIPPEGGEIEQLPLLLRHLDLQGCVASADAAHAQTHTAQVIVERGGEYVLCVKGNQPATQRAARLASIARSHWSVEPERSGDGQHRAACAARRVSEANQNALHWRLDVQWGEDQSRARAGKAATSLSALRKLAMNLLRTVPPPVRNPRQVSVRRRHYIATINPNYLAALLAHFAS